jgi:hypothetical protein
LPLTSRERLSALPLAALLWLAPRAARADEIDPDPEQASWRVPVAHAAGLMTVMRAGEAIIWPRPFAESPRHWARHYLEAVNNPPRWNGNAAPFEWDGDRWPINVIGHGLFGSELYLRARTCNKGPIASVLFTAAASGTWEYVFEGNAVRPSGLDLWFTPAAGLLLGELRFVGWRAAQRLGGRGRIAVQAILDPLGALERAMGTPC